jgi:hypothetical protein
VSGEKSPSSCQCVPWRSIKVEWEEDDDPRCGLFGSVNAWDIVVSKE